MHIRLEQLAVGQGGLFYGVLSYNNKTIKWIYDCGSNQINSLQREINNVICKECIDILFISHFDSDHISGIDFLLSSTTVKEVVLPYFDFVDASLLIGSEISNNNLTGLFLDFLAEPDRWLITRGVKIVTFMHGQGDEGPLGDGADRAPDSPRDGTSIAYGWSQDPSKIKQKAGALVRHLDTKAVISTVASLSAYIWVLAPYAYRPSPSRIQSFLAKLRKVFGTGLSLKKISSQARTADGRAKLQECYEDLWSNHNLVSMSLYCGPQDEVPWYIYISQTKKMHQYLFNSPNVGWLSTGDANLRTSRRRKALINHYSQFLNKVRNFVVPHHGAASYFSDQIISHLPNLENGIAASGKNGYGHPHPAVADAFKKHSNGNIQFHHVSEKVRSRFRVEITPC